jgi:hypothetical protein
MTEVRAVIHQDLFERATAALGRVLPSRVGEAVQRKITWGDPEPFYALEH